MILSYRSLRWNIPPLMHNAVINCLAENLLNTSLSLLWFSLALHSLIMNGGGKTYLLYIIYVCVCVKTNSFVSVMPNIDY